MVNAISAIQNISWILILLVVYLLTNAGKQNSLVKHAKFAKNVVLDVEPVKAITRIAQSVMKSIISY